MKDVAVLRFHSYFILHTSYFPQALPWAGMNDALGVSALLYPALLAGGEDLTQRHSAAKPQPMLTTDYTDYTDMGNPCHPCNPWLKFFAGCEQLGL